MKTLQNLRDQILLSPLPLTHLALNESPDHRIVIVDLQDQIKIQSLAPDWQAVKAELTQAPSWGDLSGGMMLKITGKPQRTIAADASVEELLEEFDKGMEVLEEILQDEEMKAE